ncbi:phosphate ABC transporter permease [Haloprofundus marisrubri]|uniref:Phosphate transport system permease protein n=1 Tax=Haloprofundus marisrubri TaxID=1514971 RepID=A0A0W1R7B3_9EURY|nr:phosphate ABC transporter permease subunit PstC [Haloprofundus marisrubri]KTG09309.1 phosphate ABC transporter permease [Haloprofundus marisrubri]
MSSISGFERIRQTTGSDDGALLTGAIGVVLLGAAFVAFLMNSTLTIVPVVGFIVVTAYGWYAHQAETARALTLLATTSTVLILVLITVFLILEALPAFQLMGLAIFAVEKPVELFGVTVIPGQDPLWSTSQDLYSLTPMVWGTLITTALAMLIAGPLGIAGALFISEIAPPTIREIVKPGIEIMAGVPSIVYGFVGYVIINSYMMDNFALPTFGSLFVVGIVIGLMSLPTVVSVAEDAISSVPPSIKDGSLAMGATDWQTMKSITIPSAFSGVSAAVLLGVGRAAGETMAATVILGHTQALPEPLYDVFGNTETLTSLIASQYGNATGTHMSALFAAGVVLFVSVMFLSVGSQLIEARMKRQLGGNQ